MTTISVTVNGAEHIVAASTTLEELLRTLLPDTAPTATASAVNGDYVARQARSRYVLAEHDAVTTFEPITGG
jgi:sulfur carrier protein